MTDLKLSDIFIPNFHSELDAVIDTNCTYPCKTKTDLTAISIPNPTYP